jgi:hypothetical protein
VDLSKLKTGNQVRFTLSGSGNWYTVRQKNPSSAASMLMFTQPEGMQAAESFETSREDECAADDAKQRQNEEEGFHCLLPLYLSDIKKARGLSPGSHAFYLSAD